MRLNALAAEFGKRSRVARLMKLEPRRPFDVLIATLCIALWVTTCPPVTAAPTLPSVVSTDLCSDLLLLSVAAPEQIRSVSRQSQNPRVSPVAEAARAYPPIRGGVEDLLYLQPDVALVYLGWTAQRHADLLVSQGTRIISLPYPRTWDDTLASARKVSAEIGRAAEGEALVARAERRMKALGTRHRGYRVLYLRPSGGTAGAGTYVDDVLSRLGLRNLAAEQGLSGWGRFPLERLVETPPDVFLLGYFDQNPAQARSAYGRHARFQALLARTPSVRVPDRSWGCGGLELVSAAEEIADRLDSLMAGRNGRVSASGD